MLRWLRGSNNDGTNISKSYDSVVDGLQQIYGKTLCPLEKEYRFYQFYSPLLVEGDFTAKPMVLLIGQYSTGKTSFVKHLIEKEYPGLRIGPEPTTDKFVAVMHGVNEQVVPGNASVVDPSKPFHQLSSFGNTFLSKFECALAESNVLKGITIIDTPGVLSGSKQVGRGYDFEGVIAWLAERVDMIILLFDAHKLDISDEFRRCIEALQGNQNKIRIILNKADMVSSQQLMRVYGALMWSLGKVIATPEVTRVYIGSFCGHPVANEENKKLFEAETADLYADISGLPRNSAVRKINDFIKRIRLLKAHVLLLEHLRKQIPMWGKESKKRQAIERLEDIYKTVSEEHTVPLGDFPPIEIMKTKLASFDWSKIPRIESKKLEQLHGILNYQIPELMLLLPGDQSQRRADRLPSQPHADEVTQGICECYETAIPPKWAIQKFLSRPLATAEYREEFQQLDIEERFLLSGGQAKVALVRTGLPNSALHRIWNLADTDLDGYLSLHEFALAKHLCQMKLEGVELPVKLPAILLPKQPFADANNSTGLL